MASLRRFAVPFLKIAVSSALLAFLAYKLDLRLVWDLGRSASFWWLGAACGLYVVQLLIGAWRWSVLLRAQQVDVGVRRLFSSGLVALFFNNFLPGTVGGDVIRIGDTASLAGSKTLATTVVGLDRVIGLLALVCVGAVAASLSSAGRRLLPFPVGWLWAALLLGFAAVAVALALARHWTAPLPEIPVWRREWIAPRVERLRAALARFRTHPGALGGCFAGAVAIHVVLVVVYVAIARSMSVPVSPWDLAVIVPISFVIQAIPVSLNGLGVREAAFSVCFSRLGLPLESALAVSLTSAALAAAVSLLGGAVYVARGRWPKDRDAG